MIVIFIFYFVVRVGWSVWVVPIVHVMISQGTRK